MDMVPGTLLARKLVATHTGRVIGELRDLILDDRGSITALLVEQKTDEAGTLGLSRRKRRFLVPRDAVRSFGEIVIVDENWRRWSRC